MQPAQPDSDLNILVNVKEKEDKATILEGFKEKLSQLASSWAFSAFISGCILINCFIMALDKYPTLEW